MHHPRRVPQVGVAAAEAIHRQVQAAAEAGLRHLQKGKERKYNLKLNKFEYKSSVLQVQFKDGEDELEVLHPMNGPVFLRKIQSNWNKIYILILFLSFSKSAIAFKIPPVPLNRETNKGAQLMAKMGWEGKGLGAKGQVSIF